MIKKTLNGALNHAKKKRTKQGSGSSDPPGGQLNENPSIGLNTDFTMTYPTNETGTFIDNKTIGCLFCNCKKRFDRPDEYKLHYGEKHAKVYGALSDLSIDSAQDVNKNNQASVETSINSAIIRKRRPSCAAGVSYVDEEIDPTSSSDSDASDKDDCNDESPDNTDVRMPEPGNSSNGLPENPNGIKSAEPRRKRKRSPSEPKDRDSSSSSDTSLECDVRNTVNKFVKELSKQLMKHLKTKILKGKINQKRTLYKCSKCSLHFLKQGKLLKHLKRGKHTDLQQQQCDHCKLQFTKRSLQKHVKMHNTIANGHLNKNEVKILTENDCSFNDIGSSTSDNSESDTDVQMDDPVSKPQFINKPVEEATKSKNENIENRDATRNWRENSKKLKTVLYKCDDCEEHFLSRANAENHTKNSTHHRIGKNSICNKCTYKFSSSVTLRQHERFHHAKLNLSKDDFKVITLTKFGPNLHKTMNSKRKISPESPKKNLNTKHKTNNETTDRAFLYSCEGCNQCLTSKQSLLNHIRTCEGKTSRKYLCQKCQLYFIAKYTLTRHLKVHEKYPLLKSKDFVIISRKPRNQNNAGVPQSNIVSTTEENVDDSLKEQDNCESINVSENDMCKVKLSKSTKTGWSVVSSIENCRETSSSINRQHINEDVYNAQLDTSGSIVPVILAKKKSNEDCNITDHLVTMTENVSSVHSTNNLNRESNSASTNSANKEDSANNPDSLVLTETYVGKSFEEDNTKVVNRAILEKLHEDRASESNANNSIVERKQYLHKDSDANNSNRDTNQDNNRQIKTQNFGIKLEHLDLNNEDLRIKNEYFKEERKLQHDHKPETNDVANSRSIKIANIYSIKLKRDTSTQINDTDFTDSPNLQPETKIECDLSTDVKDNVIKPENPYADENITNGIHTAIQQKKHKDHDNSAYHSDDSQNTLMLVDDDDQVDELADENLDDSENVTSSSKKYTSNLTTFIPTNNNNNNVTSGVNKNVINSTNHNDQEQKIGGCDSLIIPKNMTKNCTAKTSNFKFVDLRFRVRDRRESNHEIREESQSIKNELDHPTISSIKKEPVTMNQNQSIKLINTDQQVENQEVFEIGDSDDEDVRERDEGKDRANDNNDDDQDAVVVVLENTEIVDLTGF